MSRRRGFWGGARWMRIRRRGRPAISAAITAAALIGVTAHLLLPLYAAHANQQVRHVLTGSMEPTHMTGTTLLTESVFDRTSLQAGEVITYITANHTPPVTHRIAGTLTDDAGQLWYRTQGDANAHEDVNPLAPANVIGVVATDLDHIVSLPLVGAVPLGQFATWARSLHGAALLFGPALLALVAGELRVLLAGLSLRPRRRRTTPQHLPAREQVDEHVPTSVSGEQAVTAA